MSVDRDGIRRDAEATILAKPHLAAVARAQDCLALLAELEQAEKERDDYRDECAELQDNLRDALAEWEHE